MTIKRIFLLLTLFLIGNIHSISAGNIGKLLKKLETVKQDSEQIEIITSVIVHHHH